jgi:hypothetical protein
MTQILVIHKAERTGVARKPELRDRLLDVSPRLGGDDDLGHSGELVESPVSEFTLEMQGGNRDLIVNSTNLA